MVPSEVPKIMEMNQTDDNRSMQSVATTAPSSWSHKKFKSYIAQFDDDRNWSELSNDMTKSMRARRKLDTYLHLDLSKCTYSDDDNDNPLLFWKEQTHLSPHLSKLARKIFFISASSAAVERAFSVAGFIMS